MSTIAFKGTVGGVTYADPALFEKAARDLGYSSDRLQRASRVKLGTEVSVLVGGERVTGQVWARGERGFVWLALDNGRYATWHVSSGDVTITDGKGRKVGLGRFAA